MVDFVYEDVCIEDEINKKMRVRLYKLFAILNRVIIKRKLYLGYSERIQFEISLFNIFIFFADKFILYKLPT